VTHLILDSPLGPSLVVACGKVETLIRGDARGGKMDMLQDIGWILQEEFHHGGWVIGKPMAGMAKETYVATHGEAKVFIKFDAAPPALQRLAEMEIAPPLLRCGQHGDRPYIIQEYVKGTHPDWRWFVAHLPQLATLMGRYHTDVELARILSPGTYQPYERHIEHTLDRLGRGLAEARTGPLKTREVEESFHQLEREAERLQPVTLVPVHLDPSDKNFLITEHRIYMLDWDDIKLSDPIRDAGLLLWWYVPTARWHDFFHVYGHPLDEHALARLYWWSAASCLSISFWFDRTGDAAAVGHFLGDFESALNGKGNPRAPFGRS